MSIFRHEIELIPKRPIVYTLPKVVNNAGGCSAALLLQDSYMMMQQCACVVLSCRCSDYLGNSLAKNVRQSNDNHNDSDVTNVPEHDGVQLFPAPI